MQAAGGTHCAFCRGAIPSTARRDSEFCHRRCRQAAFRLRRRSAIVGVAGDVAGDACRVFAYADPPYPGRARRYYGKPEVDHAALVADLVGRQLGGWALSTAADALRDVLPLCPPGARVCAWVKPIGASTRTAGLHSCWEPLIVVGGRRRPPGVRDWLSAQPARFGGELPGRKPLAFCAWLFDCLGMQPGDELVDVFPGTGVVGRAWDELSSRTSTTPEPSPGAQGDTSLVSTSDTSPGAGANASSTPAPRARATRRYLVSATAAYHPEGE